MHGTLDIAGSNSCHNSFPCIQDHSPSTKTWLPGPLNACAWVVLSVLALTLPLGRDIWHAAAHSGPSTLAGGHGRPEVRACTRHWPILSIVGEKTSLKLSCIHWATLLEGPGGKALFSFNQELLFCSNKKLPTKKNTKKVVKGAKSQEGTKLHVTRVPCLHACMLPQKTIMSQSHALPMAGSSCRSALRPGFYNPGGLFYLKSNE